MFVSYERLGSENLENKLYDVSFTVEAITSFIQPESTGVYFEHLTFWNNIFSLQIII